jgi:hypothetical protein
MNRFRRSASSAPEEPASPAAPSPVGRSAGPPDKPALPPFVVPEADAPADLQGGAGCVVGWGLPYGKPTPERFELQWGYALTGSWTRVEPAITDCRRLTVRPVSRPKDGIGERWCCRLPELKPKTKYAVQVRGINTVGDGEWSKSGKFSFDPLPAAATAAAAAADAEGGGAAAEEPASGKKKGGFGARIPFGRRSTTSAESPESRGGGGEEGQAAGDEQQQPGEGGAFVEKIDYAALVREAGSSSGSGSGGGAGGGGGSGPEEEDASAAAAAPAPAPAAPPPLARPGSVTTPPSLSRTDLHRPKRPGSF